MRVIRTPWPRSLSTSAWVEVGVVVVLLAKEVRTVAGLSGEWMAECQLVERN